MHRALRRQIGPHGTHRLAGNAAHPQQASCHHRNYHCCSSCPSCPGWHARYLRSCHSQSWSLSKTCPPASSRASGRNPLEEVREKLGFTETISIGANKWRGEVRRVSIRVGTSAQLARTERFTDSNHRTEKAGHGLSLLVWGQVSHYQAEPPSENGSRGWTTAQGHNNCSACIKGLISSNAKNKIKYDK